MWKKATSHFQTYEQTYVSKSEDYMPLLPFVTCFYLYLLIFESIFSNIRNILSHYYIATRIDESNCQLTKYDEIVHKKLMNCIYLLLVFQLWRLFSGFDMAKKQEPPDFR